MKYITISLEELIEASAEIAEEIFDLVAVAAGDAEFSHSVIARIVRTHILNRAEPAIIKETETL